MFGCGGSEVKVIIVHKFCYNTFFFFNTFIGCFCFILDSDLFVLFLIVVFIEQFYFKILFIDSLTLT